ncbi:MAG: beta-glucosidase [Bacteroidales bacterium]|nr:beta-glucosidase [Bacteroidales bacterium]
MENHVHLSRANKTVPITLSYRDHDSTLLVSNNQPLDYYRKYIFKLDKEITAPNDYDFGGFRKSFYTRLDSTDKFPRLTEEELLTKIQQQTFKYFWEHAHPESGLIRERVSSDKTVTSGGSGFGLMAIPVGIERGFITREEGIHRLTKILSFLEYKADRFHGAWPHWLNGSTGEVIPFSDKDNGGDLVETAYMAQGLLTVREYLNPSDPVEDTLITKINRLWEDIEWDWYTQGEDVLYWHWSPNYGFEMDMPVRGYNETLITYVMAASSPTHSIDASVYHEGFAQEGAMQNGSKYYGYTLPLGPDYGGPLFFAHYSYLGLDPRNLEGQYANYWIQNTRHAQINHAYCKDNPKNWVGYSDMSWGLTASDNHEGYSAHSPTNDLGVITPTAAVSSIPYTPEKSMKAIKHFYYHLGDRLWGPYGFHDAFNVTENWWADSYLAIDQGPIILMIENYRSGLLWDLFMSAPEVQNGLDKLGFIY